MERRARKIANKKGVQWTLGITTVVAVVTLLQGLAGSHLLYRAEHEALKKRQEMVEYDLKNRVDVERKLQDFDNRLKDLERARQSTPSEQKKAQSLGNKTTNAPGKQP